MKGFATTQELVVALLEKYPETRCSDAELYIKVCETINPSIVLLPFVTIFRNRKRFELPDYETVGRARRRVQSMREDLRATKEVTDQRYENWKEAREYALNE